MKKFLKKNLDVIIIFAVIFSIKFFVVDFIPVEGQSMYPTLNENDDSDRVILNRLPHYTEKYNRGDIVIIKKKIPQGDSIIKRIIGIEGDKVEIKEGFVYLNDEKLNEEYINEQGVTKPDRVYIVPEGHVFVLGDNRMHSSDSRLYGFFSYDSILGEAVFRVNIFKFEANSF
ncbi:signal peptidase I [Oceanirhabdus sp. W0125-5]|uniref:signal peptidase I n=1 Tax=Oceanirhabdus sp. W0125-5 TaxID=2999116 RepID=UPI0022F2BF5F|nr:signal peptidase I [Oceanirhabdus sp. W0125-5]WBW99657.1 signal peptidase I [Oceanirhabdus sp. W0125-5]